MRVSWKYQLILAGVLMVLFLGVVWHEFKYKPSKDAEEEASKKLFSIRNSQVENLSLSAAGKEFSFHCLSKDQDMCKPGDHSAWELEKPSKRVADKSNVNSLISSLNNIAATEIIDLSSEAPEKKKKLLSDYGLSAEARADAANPKIKVHLVSGLNEIAHIGSEHPIGNKYFVLIEKDGVPDEDHIYLVPSYFKTNFDHDLTYWRDKKLVDFVAQDATEFSYSHSGLRVTGEKVDGKWVLKAKGERGTLPGDLESIDGLLTSAAYLAAKDFVSDDQKSRTAKNALFGTKTVITLRVKTKGKEENEIELSLHEKTDGKKVTLYATVKGADPLYELEPSAKDRLVKSLNDLRLTKLLSSMDRFSAKKLEISGPPTRKEPLVLVSENSKWKKQGAPDTEIDQDKVRTMLDKISGNKIKEFIDARKAPTGKEDGLTLSLMNEKGEILRKVLFWKHQSQIYARDLTGKENSKEVFLVDRMIQEALPWENGFFEKQVTSSSEAAPKNEKETSPDQGAHAH